MHLKLVLVGLAFILTLIGCKKDEIKLYPEGLIGNWISPEYNDSLVTFTRSNSLIDQDYGLAFKTGSKLVERKNAGWCGTPPITYADFEGTWAVSDSIIYISVGYWGGLAEYTWKLISLDSDYLTIARLEEKYQH